MTDRWWRYLFMVRIRRATAVLSGVLATLVVACAGPASTPARGPHSSAPQAPTTPKTLTIGISGGVPGLALMANTTPTGGGFRISEMHSDGLITSDVNSRRPLGRLAEQAPTTDDGSIS